MNDIMTNPQIWLMLGILIGLAYKTLMPWLMLKPRPAFDPKFLLAPIITAALAIYPLLALMPHCGIWWADILAGAGIGYLGQDTIRKVLQKPLENGS